MGFAVTISNHHHSQSNPYNAVDSQGYEMSSVALNNSNPFDNSTVSGGNDDMISFFSEVDEIKRSLVHYETNIERIEALHKRSLAEVADGSEGFTSNQLASLTEETSALARDLRNRIKSLESRSQRDSTKRTQADNVKHQFKNSIKRYQGIEANFRQKNKERIERQYRIGMLLFSNIISLFYRLLNYLLTMLLWFNF